MYKKMARPEHRHLNDLAAVLSDISGDSDVPDSIQGTNRGTYEQCGREDDDEN